MSTTGYQPRRHNAVAYPARNPNVMRPAPVPSTRFLWIAQEQRFVAEASDLGRQFFGRVYRDACDVGLTLISRHDGSELVFVVDHEEWREGDILWWDLVPADTVDRRRVSFTVRVFND
jgi:hypothetical protein